MVPELATQALMTWAIWRGSTIGSGSSRPARLGQNCSSMGRANSGCAAAGAKKLNPAKSAAVAANAATPMLINALCFIG